MTLLNKAAFQSVDFNYPYFLSAVHMICNSAGSQLIFWSLERARNSGDKSAVEANPVTQLLGTIQRQSLDAKGQRLILAFSVIFSLNIAIGNVSLKYVSVNFNQVRKPFRSVKKEGVCWNGLYDLRGLSLSEHCTGHAFVGTSHYHCYGTFPWQENLIASSIGRIACHYWSGHGVFWRHVVYCHWFLLHCHVYLTCCPEGGGQWRNVDGTSQAAPCGLVGSHVSHKWKN